MGQTSDQLAAEIDQTREDLRANFEELEARARDAADWRTHFRRHPEKMVAAALMGGVLLSLLLGRR